MSEAHLLAPARSGSSRRSETTIDAVEVIVTSPGRNFVTVKVTTSGGAVGWGDATLNGRELAVASYLRDHLAPILLGRDAHRIQDTWQYLYRGVYWRGGPVAMAAISAIDMALWDIKGKIAGLPVYQLLGGASRTGIRAYGHATGRDIPELLDSVAAHRDSGFTAVRIQTGVPGLGQVYGIAGADATVNIYEPAAAGRRPTEETWDSSSYLSHAPRMFAAVREAFGTEVDLLHDVHHRLTPVEAARLGKTLEEFTPFWLEDVTPAESPQVLALVRQHTTVPLAIGEVFTSVHDYEVMFRDRLIDFVRSAPTHAGGITGITRILQAGALGGARSALHGPTDVSPVGMAAALHIDLTVHNFGIQECMPQADVVSTVFRSSHGFRAGAFSVSDAPGLGVEVDEEAARAFPYQRAYLPVARLRDGTMHDW